MQPDNLAAERDGLAEEGCVGGEGDAETGLQQIGGEVHDVGRYDRRDSEQQQRSSTVTLYVHRTQRADTRRERVAVIFSLPSHSGQT
jgi:hypothetical protein